MYSADDVSPLWSIIFGSSIVLKPSSAEIEQGEKEDRKERFNWKKRLLFLTPQGYLSRELHWYMVG